MVRITSETYRTIPHLYTLISIPVYEFKIHQIVDTAGGDKLMGGFPLRAGHEPDGQRTRQATKQALLLLWLDFAGRPRHEKDIKKQEL